MANRLIRNTVILLKPEVVDEVLDRAEVAIGRAYREVRGIRGARP